jgi:hypothetical protein
MAATTAAQIHPFIGSTLLFGPLSRTRTSRERNGVYDGS